MTTTDRADRAYEEPTVRLSRDEFTARRRDLTNNPASVNASSRIDETDPYGNIVTWIVDSIRVGSSVTAFLQRGGTHDHYIRLVLPPSVTSAINRQQAGLVTKARRKTSKRVVADKRARGERVGNPLALTKAREARKTRKAKKAKRR